MEPSGPLTPAELAELEATLLPALERHHLRLLAHGLRTLQTIAGRRAGPAPTAEAIRGWLDQQDALAADPDFRQAFAEQLQGAARQLSSIAAAQGRDPLALELEALCHWATGQADQRLANISPAKPRP